MLWGLVVCHNKIIDRIARFAAVSPIALLAAMALPTSALADQTVSAGVVSGPIELNNHENFTNDGSVNGGDVDGVTDRDGAGAATIINSATGSIFSEKGIGVNISGPTNAFDNAGTISTGSYIGVNLGGDTGSIDNSGSISGIGGMVTGGNVTAFTNAAGGAMSGFFVGVSIRGTTGTFLNAGAISGGMFGADLEGNVASFVNAGTISGDSIGIPATAAKFAADVGTFVNTSTGVILSSGGGDGVHVDGATGSLVNDGLISGSVSGAYLRQNVGSLTNAGTIAGGAAGVWADGDVARFTNLANARITGGDDAAVRITGLASDFTNAGSIFGTTGVFLRGRVISFSNLAGGSIVSTDGYGVALQSVGDFSNAGRIAGVFDGVISNSKAGSFINAEGASIVGADGVALLGEVGSFANAGSIVGYGRLDRGVYLGHGVGTFVNTATGVISATDPDGREGILIGSATGSFINAGTISTAGGVLSYGGVDRPSNAVRLQGGVTTLINSGTIAGRLYGLEVDAAAGTVTNTGTIAGATIAAAFEGGVGNMINAGVLRGATAFESAGAFDDRLTLLTGSQVFGAVDFGAGADTLDFSKFIGNTVLDVTGLDTLAPGDRPYFDLRDASGDGKVVIADLNGQGSGLIGTNAADLTRSIWDLIDTGMHAVTLDGTPAAAPSAASAYAPAPRVTAAERATETIATDGLAAARDVHVWGGVLGGSSVADLPVDRQTRFYGLVTGAHARVSSKLSLGGVAGYVDTSNTLLGGDEQLHSQTGVVGVYGSTDMTGFALDFALLGGVGGHTSERKVVADHSIETAEGVFSSFFIAPTLGVTVPMLADAMGDVALKASASYVGGLTSSYTETGTSANLTVGSQSISVFDARFGLEGRHDLGSGGSGKATLVAKAGVLANANAGSANVPVTALGETIEVSMPGSNAVGLYGGIGVEAALGSSLGVGLHIDGSRRSDGASSAAFKTTLSGTF